LILFRGILYARVSTIEQTIEHQAAQARAAGFAIDEVVADNGVSGVSTRLVERLEGKRLYDKLRRGDVLVVRWSIAWGAATPTFAIRSASSCAAAS
jgi:DNA invertase Pin-like site-specific DNA recombinase